MKKIFSLVVLLMLTFSISGCCTFWPAHYSDEIYNLMVDCKHDALVLMDKSVTSYSENQADIDNIQKKLSKLGSLLNDRRKDDPSCKQYALLMARDKALFGEFLVRWQEKDKFSRVFIDDSKTNISAAFDEMIKTESARKK